MKCWEGEEDDAQRCSNDQRRGLGGHFIYPMLTNGGGNEDYLQKHLPASRWKVS